MRIFMNALLSALIVVVISSSSASAEMIRSATGYSSSEMVDERPYIASNIRDSLGGTSWGIVGMNVDVPSRMKLDMITGVGGYIGDATPMVGIPFLNIYSSTEAFRTSNLVGDVYSGEMDFALVEEFSLESAVGVENYYLELAPEEEIILDEGSYVFAVGLEFFADNWSWVYSTEDLGSDLFVSNSGEQLHMLDSFSDTGTVATDIFVSAVPEPTTLLLSTMIGGWLCCRRRSL